ncbi:hypothetical protein BH20ACT2_BH20ACT2_25190 [soil metagenome]
MTVTHLDEGLKRRRETALRDHLAAERSGDAAAIIATFAHPRYELIPTNRVYDGPTDVRRYLDERRHAFPDLHTEIIDLHHAEAAVLAEIWLMGTHRGTVADLEATGRTFKCRMAVLFLFEGADLVGARVYFDLGTIARQLA